MTPLQKGMVKAYFKSLLYYFMIFAMYIFINWSDKYSRMVYFIMPFMFSLLAVYVYYMENRKKAKDKLNSIYKDMLQIFMVTFLFCNFIFIILMLDGWIFLIIFSIILSGIVTYFYYKDMKKTINKPEP